MALREIGEFYFVSYHGRLLQAYTNGTMHASQEVSRVGEEERWHVHHAGHGKVALRNHRTNKWLRGEANGEVKADRPSCDGAEKWSMYKHGTKVGFKSAYGGFLRSHPPGNDTQWGGEVEANAPRMDTEERYDMVPSASTPLPGPDLWQTVVSTVADDAPTLIELA